MHTIPFFLSEMFVYLLLWECDCNWILVQVLVCFYWEINYIYNYKMLSICWTILADLFHLNIPSTPRKVDDYNRTIIEVNYCLKLVESIKNPPHDVFLRWKVCLNRIVLFIFVIWYSNWWVHTVLNN